MFRSPLPLMLFLTVSLSLVSAAAPAAGLTTSSYLTTAITQSGMKQTTVGGNGGVLVNYTSSYPSSFTAFIYLDLVNSAGQTIYWSIATCSFNANQKVPCFVTISSAVPTGTFTAKVFATTASSVPVSITSSLQVTL